MRIDRLAWLGGLARGPAPLLRQLPDKPVEIDADEADE
jgi:hypothetical protein